MKAKSKSPESKKPTLNVESEYGVCQPWALGITH
jgi:hypothetical protein